MTISLKHSFTSAKSDGGDNTLVQPSNWNAEHQLTLANNTVLGRNAGTDGAAQELSGSDLRTLTGLATSDSPQFTALNVGHATDTTIARVSAGVISVEGSNVILASNKLSALSATTSAELAGVISDETGSGALVFATTPTFVTSALFPAGAVGTPSIAADGDTNTGVWFPAADTIAASTGGTERLRIDSEGKVGIGGTPTLGRTLFITRNMTGSTSPYGVFANGQVQSDATNQAVYFRATASTADATFSTNINQFEAVQGTFGAASTVANQRGFFVGDTLVNATNNYGFFSNIPAGVTRTIANVERTSNVVTITTSVAHGYAARQSVTVTATANTSVNGTFTITSVPTTTTFTYAQTAADLASTADTGSTVIVGRWNFYALNTAPNYFAGNVGIGTNAPDALLTVNTIASFGDGAVATPSIAHKGDLNTGLWFPAADTIAASTNGAERMRITSAGSVGIGGTGAAQNTFSVQRNITGNAFSAGVVSSGQVQSDVTSRVDYFLSAAAVAAGTYPTVNGFQAQQSTLTGTVTNQRGFSADASLTGATNNFGFYGNIASGTTQTITTVARTSNVVTITTSVAHGYTAGQSVTVAATTNTSLNGTFAIASVPTTTTFTYAQTAADLASTADTGSTVVVGRWNFYAAGTAPNYFAGNVGIGTTAPTNILSLSGNAARTVWMERHTTADTAGNDLTVQSGGATSGATNKAGGNLVLSSGTATGTGSSLIRMLTAAAGGAGTTDRAPAERFRVTSAGVEIANGSTGSTLEYLKAGYSITPWINVKTDYGATGNGSTDDTTAINNAIAAANSSGANLYFPPGTYKVSTLSTISGTGRKVVGSGRDTTIIATNSATGNVMTISGYMTSVEGFTFRPSVYRTSGYELAIDTSTQCLVREIFIEYGFNGIYNYRSSSIYMDSVTIRSLSGSYGIYFGGTAASPGYGFYLSKVLCDSPYVGAAVASSVKGNLANSTAYSLNDVVISNSWIWQCTTAGTSAASASLAAPTTTSWITTAVTTGTASFRAISRNDLTWLQQESYGNSIGGTQCIFLNGAFGFRMLDTAAVSGSYPNWAYFFDLEVDHSYTQGVSLEAGLGFHAAACWVGSVLNGNGINMSSNYKGETTVADTRILGNAEHGILMNAGTDVKINNCFLANNGTKTTNTYNGITVANSLTGFVISNCSTGYITPFTSSDQAYGIQIGTSCDYFVVTGNLGRGNVTGNINNGSSTGTNKIVANNN